MKPTFWSLFFIYEIISLWSFGVGSYALAGNLTDRLSLLEFKAKIIKDPFRVTNSWNNSKHFCQWPGVTCSRQYQRIIVLDLNSLQLVGSIPPHIGNLSLLRELYLQNNSFRQEIPPEIGHLRKLQILYLFNNSFQGEIPSNITGCSNLIELSAYGNQLVGEIPPKIDTLSKLQEFVLSRNSLTGSIPPSFGNLSTLLILFVSQNNLSGSIPDALGKLVNLKSLVLEVNALSGMIPSSLFNISCLTELHLGFNEIHGTLPSNLGSTLPNLQNLQISDTQLTGSIPPSLSNASKLEQLQLVNNKLTGKVPEFGNSNRLIRFMICSNYLGGQGADDLNFLSSLTNATGLQKLLMAINNFEGILPGHVCNLSNKLTDLDFCQNAIFGSIPTAIQNLLNLQFFSLSNNRLSGSIPSVIGSLHHLVILSLAGNEFSGPIPSSIGNLTKLTKLYLFENYLQQNIPSRLGDCQNLIELDLAKNNLSGFIPLQVIGLSSLSIALNLSNNYLTGVVPTEVGNLKNLGALDLSNNKLTGEIPNSLGECTILEVLYMRGNSFQGPIPSSLYSLKGLREFDISKNNLSGEIPNFFEDFKLIELLDLSYNNFEGAISEEGVFKNSSATSVMGNKRLCGGIPEFHLPECNLKHSKRIFTLAFKIVIFIVVGLFCLSLVLVFLLCSSRKKTKELASSTSIYEHLIVSYQSILKATNGFSTINLIDVGSFGSVYKGVLEPSGMTVAIKVFNLIHGEAFKSFMAECEVLRNIRHRNIVKILSVCSRVDYLGNDFKAVVYKYMSNGSLEKWLHQVDRAPETPKSLNLLQRLNIAIDVACALDYLHNQCQTAIVHCDLKPSNVLLDGNMTGHVGDFGLARFLQVQDVACDSSSNQASSIGLRGTIGYVAPEYGMGGEVSTQSDVYSYGILLLEIFTRKRPTDEMFKDSLNLHNYVAMALHNRDATVIDPFLFQEMVERETRSNTSNHYHGDTKGKRVKDCLFSVLEIGVACSAEFPQDRRNIGNVVAKLISIRRVFLN